MNSNEFNKYLHAGYMLLLHVITTPGLSWRVGTVVCVPHLSQLKDGEINFWMPLTDYSRTQTTLWVESGPNTGDFHPLALDVGRIAMFHGTLVRHYAPPNPTKCLRVSMDFRVGIGKYYDPDWKLEGLQHYHGRLKIVL